MQSTLELNKCSHFRTEDKVFDPEVTYARAMGLQSSTQVQDTKKLVSHELSSYPPPMFDKKKHMGQAKP